MILRAFALLDVKVGHFNTPFFMQNEHAAKRACADLAGDLSTTVGRHPADFGLYEIGTYDDSNGQMTSCAMISHGLVVQLLPKPSRSFEEWRDPSLMEPRSQEPRPNGYHPEIKQQEV